jgi:hypothetical protein
MIRNLVALFALGLTGVAIAGEPPQTLPQSTWRKSIEGDRGTWTLTFDGKGAKFVGREPTGKSTTTYDAPVCVLSEDGKTAFGYIARIIWVDGDEHGDLHCTDAYAFTFKVKGDVLEITDFKMTGVDPRYFKWMAGTFSKVPPEETAQVPKEPSTLER